MMRKFVIHDRAGELREYLSKRGYTFENRPNQLFLARGPGVVVNVYKTGTVLVQGKNVEEANKIAEFIAGITSSTTEQIIGTDEAGKGDYFGPAVVAGVYLTEEHVRELSRKGVALMDSKKMSDEAVLFAASLIAKTVGRDNIAVTCIDPAKYNELHRTMNMNEILAKAHQKVIRALSERTEAEKAVVDRFADVKISAPVEVTMETKAESKYPAVAAASIIARAFFLRKLQELEKRYNFRFPKGAGEAVSMAKERFIRERGEERLWNVAKVHFNV